MQTNLNETHEKINPVLLPYFEKTRGEIEAGCHRIVYLLLPYFESENFGDFFLIPSILVTGSNGKGSTCAYLESILRENQIKTGFYSSPHIKHPQERIRINGDPIGEETFIRVIQEIENSSKLYLPNASFFEIMTASAFLYFHREKIDVLVCEVGLGGRFDSTNILSPIVSVLTNVTLEHCDILGDTIEKIASDKSFISRRNRPFILGRTCPESMQGIQRAKTIIGSRIIFSEQKTEDENLNTALTAIQNLPQNIFHLNKNKIKSGIQKMFWPGRFDIRVFQFYKNDEHSKRTLILDSAHTSDGTRYFIEKYKKSPYAQKKPIFLFASLKEKDWKKSLELMDPFETTIILTTMKSSRSEDAFHMQKQMSTNFKSQYLCEENISSALLLAYRNCKENQILIILGSIAFLGVIFEKLNFVVYGP